MTLGSYSVIFNSFKMDIMTCASFGMCLTELVLGLSYFSRSPIFTSFFSRFFHNLDSRLEMLSFNTLLFALTIGSFGNDNKFDMCIMKSNATWRAILDL